jgi:anti-sigma factor RsiW
MGTTRQFTCKHLLKELTDYLDGSLDPEVRTQLEAHLAKCPNCWVVCDTTKKTIEVFKGLDPYPLPDEVKGRLVKALQKRCSESGKS